MPRFILRYRGSGSAKAEDVSRIHALPHTTILDSSSDRMMLVDGPEDDLRAAVDNMPNWVLFPEQHVPLPDTRKKVLHSPGDTDTGSDT